MDVGEEDLGSDFSESEYQEVNDQLPDSTTSSVRRKDWSFMMPNKKEVILQSQLPGGSTRDLYPINIIPEKYRSVFSEYHYFNLVQSLSIPHVFYKSNSVAVCAPTGTGKTGIFELAIIKVLIDHDNLVNNKSFTDKIIYMCPLKALCNERLYDWRRKFEVLGIKVCEVTGDSELEEHALVHRSNIIITTPEKWDSMTRKWKDHNRMIMDQTKLICIDEVHLLSENNRGACLEALVSRVKTAKYGPTSPAIGSSDSVSIRFIAVSATAPNIDDVSKWLGVSSLPGIHLKMAAELRPVKVSTQVIGFNFNGGNVHTFDMMLSSKIPELIRVYGDNKPTLVFCMTRHSCETSAQAMSRTRPIIADVMTRKLLHERSRALIHQKSSLREMFEKGIAFHHAGLTTNDRSIIEATFSEGLMIALFSTSTLAAGVNLPAHLVILKGTSKYVCNTTVDLSETDILQMTGRAGRPQFDDSAVALILCRKQDESKYSKLVKGEKTLESCLHNSLIEHLNAEIVLNTITDVSVAMKWLKSTFFYIRCLKNKGYYGVPVVGGDEVVENHLRNICMKELNGLRNHRMITMTTDDPPVVSPTEIGRLMANLYISYETMKDFVCISSKTPLKDLLYFICKTKEMTNEVSLRNEEKKLLFSLHDLKAKCMESRFKVRFQRKEKIKTVSDKIYTLFQCEFGCFVDDHIELKKMKPEISRLLRIGGRMSKCLLDFITLPNIAQEKGFQTVKNAILLSKIFRKGIWENSTFVVKQFDGVGPAISNSLVRRGNYTSFESLSLADARALEGLASKKHPWGQTIIDMAKSLPNYMLTVRQVSESPKECKVSIELSLSNQAYLQENANSNEKKTSKKWNQGSKTPASTILIVGNMDDKILTFKRFPDDSLIAKNPSPIEVIVPKSENSPQNRFFVGVINDTWIGIDIPKLDFEVNFTYFSSLTDKILMPIFRSGVPFVSKDDNNEDDEEEGQNEKQVFPIISQSLASSEQSQGCLHRCHNKNTCSHRCCKTANQVTKFAASPSVTQPTIDVYARATQEEFKRSAVSQIGCDVKKIKSSFDSPYPPAPPMEPLVHEIISSQAGMALPLFPLKIPQPKKPSLEELMKFQPKPQSIPQSRILPKTPKTAFAQRTPMTTPVYEAAGNPSQVLVSQRRH